MKGVIFMLYCMSVDSIYNRLYPNLKKVLCLETAAAHLGLSRGWGIPVKFYHDSEDYIINSAYLVGLKKNTMEEVSTINIRGIECTSKEYTLIDLINNSERVDDQIIYESLATYYYENNGDITKLSSLISEDSRQRFDYYLEGAESYYDE